MIQGQGILCRQVRGSVDFLQLLHGLGIQGLQVDPLPHGGGEPAFGVVAIRNDLAAPMGAGWTVWRGMEPQDVQQKQVQETLGRVKFGEAYVLDFLGDVCLVYVIHTLTAPEAAEQVSLVLGPGQDVVFARAVWHG